MKVIAREHAVKQFVGVDFGEIGEHLETVTLRDPPWVV